MKYSPNIVLFLFSRSYIVSFEKKKLRITTQEMENKESNSSANQLPPSK